jgi:GR25 family glycosyltransferase involved in LPS biosynthesis
MNNIKIDNTQKELCCYDNDIIRLKLICNSTSSIDLCNCLDKMSMGNGRWNNIRITYEDDDIDYFVIINRPQKGEFYIPSKTIVFRMEPDTETHIRWNDWYESKDEFLYFLDLSKFRNNSEWHMGLSYKEMMSKSDSNEEDLKVVTEENEVVTEENKVVTEENKVVTEENKVVTEENKVVTEENNINIKKTKVLSAVVSSLFFMEGHKKRLIFIKYLQLFSAESKINIDVYGRDNIFNMENYKGELPYHNKNEGILPYKYTFTAENCSLNNYFTEKIIDSIVGEALCFYWGCPNLENFIDSRAFIRLDLNDLEGSLKIVVDSIANNEWEKRIDIIRKEKKKIINHYSLFPRVEGLILLSKTLSSSVINLDRRLDRWISFEKEAKRVGFKNYNRVSAIDGHDTLVDDNLVNMFRNFYGHPKKGEVGCALSHFNIWNSIIKRSERRKNGDNTPEDGKFINELIMEDDITFSDNFVDKLALVYNEINNSRVDFDIIFIGYTLNKDSLSEDEFNTKMNVYIKNEGIMFLSLDEISKNKTRKNIFGYHGGGMFGYIISPQGAQKLVDNILTNGFVWPVDYHILLQALYDLKDKSFLDSETDQEKTERLMRDSLKIYCLTDRLVLSDMFSLEDNSPSEKTDIQNTSNFF